LRESLAAGERLTHRELFDLGTRPGDFVVYPGGNSFYFRDDLVEALSAQGVPDLDRQLESLFLPFLPGHIQRIVIQMTRLGRGRQRCLSRQAMEKAQSRLHLFDRRRLYYLRFGRMDSPETIARPHRFLNVLVEKSRDEIEHHFRRLEAGLRIREMKQFVYQALDLGRYFPGEFARLFPLGLDQEKLDQALVEELCRLNRDPDFLDPLAATGPPGETLSEHLIPYAIFWFDYEFGQRPPQDRIFEEFMRGRAAYRPPPVESMELSQACRMFAVTEAEWVALTRGEVSRLYRRLARGCHPDQGGDAKEFIALTEAYERLLLGK
jgi:hypothetical protein